MPPESAVDANRLLHTPLREAAMRMVPPALLAALLGGMQLYVDYLVAAYTLPITAVAAVSASQPMQYLIFAMEALLAVGAANVVSMSIGRRELQDRRALAATLNQLALGGGLLLALAAPLLIPSYRGLVALADDAGAQAASYLSVLLAGSVTTFAAASRVGILQATGRMRAVFGALFAGTTVNVLASLAGATWLGFGITGIAVGTVAGHVTCAAVAERALRRAGLGMPMTLTGADGELRARILGVGQSAMLVHLMFLIQTTAMFRAVGIHGDSSDSAVLGAAFRVVMLGVYMTTGVGRAMQPLLAASHAAGLRERAAQILRQHVFLAFVLVSALALPMLLLPERTIDLLLPVHAADAQDIARFRAYVLILPTLPVLLLGMVLLQATGRAATASLLASLRLLGLFLPLLYLGTAVFGIDGIYSSLLAAEWLLVPVLLGFARRQATAVDGATFGPTVPAERTSS